MCFKPLGVDLDWCEHLISLNVPRECEDFSVFGGGACEGRGYELWDIQHSAVWVWPFNVYGCSPSGSVASCYRWDCAVVPCQSSRRDKSAGEVVGCCWWSFLGGLGNGTR